MKTSMFGPLLLFHILMHLCASHDTNFCNVNTEDGYFCDITEPICRKRRNGGQRVRERPLIQTPKITQKNRKIGTERRDTSSSKEGGNNQNGDCVLAHAHLMSQQIQMNQVKIRGSKRKKKKIKRKKKWKRKKNKHKFVHKSCQIRRT